MELISAENYTKSITYLFKETFEGTPPQGGMYLDTGIGLFSSIDKLDEDKASKSIAGANIAAHIEHIRYYLEVINNFIDGTVQVADWSKSWNIKEVTEDEWKTIKEALQNEYESVLEAFENHKEWNEDTITQANAMLLHSSYHLGAIRQIIKTF